MSEDEALFELGRVQASEGVGQFSEGNEKLRNWLSECLIRHHAGDCGDMSQDDQVANLDAILNGRARVFSSFNNKELPEGKVWIITEADRSLTTILFPGEY